MKRTKLNTRSKKRRQQYRQAKPTLRAFAEEHGFCWCCCGSGWLAIHHIVGRVGRSRHDRRGLFRCCRDCHETRWTNPTDGLSPLDRLAQQLAYKFVFDREFYDREFVLQCAGYASTAVTDGEVAVLVELIRGGSDG